MDTIWVVIASWLVLTIVVVVIQLGYERKDRNG